MCMTEGRESPPVCLYFMSLIRILNFIESLLNTKHFAKPLTNILFLTITTTFVSSYYQHFAEERTQIQRE